MEEFGIFSDEGLLEGGFVTKADAEAVLADEYGADGAYVSEICPDHPEYERECCEECNQ